MGTYRYAPPVYPKAQRQTPITPYSERRRKGEGHDCPGHADRSSTVQRLRTYRCALSFLATATNAEYHSAEGTKALAVELNQIGGKLKDQDIGFGYHTHHVEFARFTGKTILEELVDNTDPELVAIEIDVH